MLIARVVRMRYPEDVYYLVYNTWRNYHAYTQNASDKLGYKVIKSVHIGVELLYDHGRARERGAT